MRYKPIAAVGASLIAAVTVISGLMYYFNQDVCPLGTFQCHNSTVCIPQGFWCNQVPECPYKDDEGEQCINIYSNWDWFSLDRAGFILRGEEKCESTGAPFGCTYDNCNVNCQNVEGIPQNLSSYVAQIRLNESRVPRISVNDLSRYTELKILNINDSQLMELEKGAFVNQSKLIWLILRNNEINEILPGHLIGLTNLDTLSLYGNKITVADLSDLENSTTIYLINLNKNQLTESTLKLPHIPALGEIFLEENRFESIPEGLFAGCPALKTVSLGGNAIRTIDENAFQMLSTLIDLNLSDNDIKILPPDLLRPLINLTNLLLNNNPLTNFEPSILKPLKNLHSLVIENVELNLLRKNAFNELPQIKFLYFSNFYYCTTYAPKVQNCKPSSDGVSSLSHLLGKPLLRAAVWGISCITCTGNALVLWGRFMAREDNRVLSILVGNLALSDMLMGIYLFIIAVKDSTFRDNYNQHASSWISSTSCTLAGILAMISSEVSMLILSFMSVERFMLIAAPLNGHRAMKPQTAWLSMIIIWVIGIILALVPVVYWRSSTRFYGVNGMCFPLHIDDPYLIGWEYSAFIFLGLNLLGLLTIGYVYAGMFASIWKTQRATPLSVKDSEFALRFFLIVFTDAACWAPIIVLKIRALMEYPVPADLYAWVVVFILPVNSAVNPLLYTFTTPKFRERLARFWFGKLRNYLARQNSMQASQISSAVSNKQMTDASSTENSYQAKMTRLFGFTNEKILSKKEDHIL